MIGIHRHSRAGVVALALASTLVLGACSQAGGLANVLGSVLGGQQQQQGGQVSGTIRDRKSVV